MSDEDRPLLMVLLGALVWAAVSTLWSPYHPKSPDRSVALQLALALPLTWSAVCGARRADPRLSALALRILGWGLALFAAVLLADVAVNGRFYHALHVRFYEPMRLDEAQNALAHASTALAVLWPVALASRLRGRLDLARLVVAAVGTALAAHVFRGDAPLYAAVLAVGAIGLVRRWPAGGPRLLAAGVAAVGFAMPALVWAVRESGDYIQLERFSPPSWAARMTYWSHAIDWIFDRPLRGWGLDASRAMGPGIQLHPHNAALQVWLELGLIGAVAAAVFWALSLLRLARERPDGRAAAVAGSVAAFVFISWVNYGAWQAWWLAVGGLIPVIAALHARSDPTAKST
jgi:O-antigen ligase